MDSDFQLCDVLKKLMGLNIAGELAAQGGSQVSGRRKRPAPQAASTHNITVAEFVSRTMPLIDIEREAEMALTTEEISQLSPETAQARGRTLCNLKVRFPMPPS